MQPSISPKVKELQLPQEEHPFRLPRLGRRRDFLLGIFGGLSESYIHSYSMPAEGEVASNTPLDPSRLSFESVWIRRRILASYWLVVLLAVPLWWKATSIDRLSLPGSRVRGLSKKELSFPIQVHLRSDTDSHPASDVASQVTELLGGDLQEQGSLLVEVVPTSTDVKTQSEKYEVVLTSGYVEPTIRNRSLVVSLENQDDASAKFAAGARIATYLRLLLAPLPALTSGITHRVVKYAPQYRLAFTLLNQDAASGKAALSWDVQGSIQHYIQPTLDRLSVLHNFTIESQVQLHAPLAFLPTTIVHNDSQAFGLTPEDLTVFVNSAEWTLSSSVSNDPVLHFVVFVPSLENSPLYLLDNDGSVTNSNAFVLPQWGGIVVLNHPRKHLPTKDLRDTFITFESQLQALLGVPMLPPTIKSSDSTTVTDWQLDALVRRRTQQNAVDSRETLESIVSLVNQIQNMPVGQDVKGDVQNALNALDQVHSHIPSSSIEALHRSAKALALSSRAFFNPGMLALLYFPAEHTYAVYTPLFASVAAPLFAAVVREIAAWRRSRRERAEQARNAEAEAERPKTD